MQAELSTGGQSLRSLHTTFAAPVSHGAVDINVEVLRRGRSMSHLRAEVRNPAAARGHLTTAVFGSPRPGFEFTDLAPPAGFIPLKEARSFRDPPPPGTEPFPQRRSGSSASKDEELSATPPGRITGRAGLSTARGTGWTSHPSSRTGPSTRWP